VTRIRNATRARYNLVELSHSRLREAICRVLLAEGFLPESKPPVRVIEEAAGGTALLAGTRIDSQGNRAGQPSSIRRYAGAKSMPRVSGGLGLHVVTTPLGVMTDREARRRNVGGEVLLKVW